MKDNVDMAMAKLTNLSNLTYLGQKYKFDWVGILDAIFVVLSNRIRIEN